METDILLFSSLCGSREVHNNVERMKISAEVDAVNEYFFREKYL